MCKLLIKNCFAVLLLLQSTVCFAACKSTAGYVQFPQMPLLTGSISLGEDAPVGTVLYRQTFTPSGTYTLTCDTPTDIEILYTTTGTKSSYTGSFPFAEVFETGYAGIGYAVWNARRGISYGSMNNSQTYTLASGVTSATLEKDDLQVEFALIKTGNISAGVLDTSSLMAILAVVASNNLDTALGLYFTGNLTITLPTCITPDYTVNLGKWGQARFNGKGAASAWVDSSIRLTGCGQFNGNFTENTGSTNVWSDNRDYSAASPEQNRWSVSFSSINGVIDADNGIISTDTSATDAAQGVGIQLSQGEPDSAGTNLLKIGDSAMTGTFTTTGETSYVIPLSARIIQTEDSVVAGNVTGKVVYTLNYL
ncbi:TPA: fimbrial protein [Enterobacter cloacae]